MTLLSTRAALLLFSYPSPAYNLQTTFNCLSDRLTFNPQIPYRATLKMTVFFLAGSIVVWRILEISLPSRNHPVHYGKGGKALFFSSHCGDRIILPGRQNWEQIVKILPKSCDPTVWNGKMWLGKIQTICYNILPPHQSSPAPAVSLLNLGFRSW